MDWENNGLSITKVYPDVEFLMDAVSKGGP